MRVCVCPRLQSIHTEYLQVISKRNEVFWQSDVDTHCYCEGCTGWKTFFINNHSVRQGWNSLPEHNALTNILKNQENVNLRSSFRQSGAKPAALRQQQQKHTGMDDKEFTGGANSFNTEQNNNRTPSRCSVVTWLLPWTGYLWQYKGSSGDPKQQWLLFFCGITQWQENLEKQESQTFYREIIYHLTTNISAGRYKLHCFLSDEDGLCCQYASSLCWLTDTLWTKHRLNDPLYAESSVIIELWIFKVNNNFAEKSFFYCIVFTTKSSQFEHLDPNTVSFVRHITPVSIISTQSHIQLVLNEVWTSFTVSQETPPGRGQAPHWRNLIIGHQLWSIILVKLSTTASHQIPHETAALLTIFAATHTHTHPQRSRLASLSQPNDVHRATGGARGGMKDSGRNH